ncbi:hypothetical protein AVEN_164747-1 [Araneus ventricosus]|uniref:Uncharacterized protein n=1 Tax=Araneus ventricosus TaxID=182803 RepID=A0A4Y2TII5_ARAVE|nr:hypothetical protein AVEN_254353-1 [Araneus ventricosus]GBN99553.1 hypothetical protein AVEN_164747-1 [Araneus ventricosus]
MSLGTEPAEGLASNFVPRAHTKAAVEFSNLYLCWKGFIFVFQTHNINEKKNKMGKPGSNRIKSVYILGLVFGHSASDDRVPEGERGEYRHHVRKLDKHRSAT